MDNSSIEKKITELISDFLRQEQGNRVTAYNMNGLLGALMRLVQEKGKANGQHDIQGADKS